MMLLLSDYLLDDIVESYGSKVVGLCCFVLFMNESDEGGI